MSLNNALSGLLGAQDALNVTSNNLANASTTGFKSGSAIFSDVYPAGSANAPGQGVAQQFIQQDYGQGNLKSTGNPLDLAIQGNGFFITKKTGAQSYTRDGAFQLSPSGQLQTATGSDVQGFGLNSSGKSNGILVAVQVSTIGEPAKASSKISLSAALNTADPVITTPFNAGNPATYDQSTSVVAYDSLGNPNHVQLYFAQQPASASATTPGPWNIYAQPQSANGSSVGAPVTLTTLKFNSSGALTSGASANLAVNWGNGAAPSNINFNFGGTSLSNQSFAINSLTNNGYGAGTFTGTSIAKNGNVSAQYSNGHTKVVAQLAMASFINNQGLIPTSNNLFEASPTSGQPVINMPSTGVNGTIVSGSLEQSNTSTSSDLVSLIVEQEQYQANTSVIQGVQQDTQKLLQLV
jgi:flagellar hook protein FlgE